MANPLAASTPQMPASSLIGLPHAPGCCEVGQPIYADPRTGQAVCSCQLSGGMVPGGPRVPGPGDMPYALPPTLHGPGAVFAGGESPAFYASMGTAYGLKEGPEVFQGISPLNGYYPYDPTMIYPYMNGFGGLDARRKNATKESTNTLKAWLYEHRKNPYPTKGEKIMLAILTKMTLTQVSTWFANARRRLKKENKVGWSSKDGDDDEDGDDDKDDDKTGSDDEDIGRAHNDRSIDDDDGCVSDVSGSLEPEESADQKEEDVDVDGEDDDIDVNMCPAPPSLRQQFPDTPSRTAVVPITPPPSPRARHAASVPKDNFGASSRNISSSGSSTSTVRDAHPVPHPCPVSRTVACAAAAQPQSGQPPKQNSGSAAPKPKIWSVTDMVSKKDPAPASPSSSSASISPPGGIRHMPTAMAHAQYLSPQFYPGFNGLSGADGGMSLALAYSRGLAAVGSAGLQGYPPMAAHFHPGMEGGHPGSMPPSAGGRPIDPSKSQSSHTAISGVGVPMRRDRSPVDDRRRMEPIRLNEERGTAFRPVALRR